MHSTAFHYSLTMSSFKREATGEESDRATKVAKHDENDSVNGTETSNEAIAGNSNNASEMQEQVRLLKSENKMMQSQLEAAAKLVKRDRDSGASASEEDSTYQNPQSSSIRDDSDKLTNMLDKALSDQKALKPSGTSSDELTTAKQELKSTNKTVTLLSDSLEEARAEVKTLRESAASSKTIVSGLMEEKQELTSSNRHLQVELERTMREMNEAKEEIRSSERTISLLSNSLERARNEIVSMKVTRTDVEVVFSFVNGVISYTSFP